MRIAGFSGSNAVLTGRGEPEQLVGTMSIGGLFDVTGVRPFLGRAITEKDEDPAAPPVVMPWIFTQGLNMAFDRLNVAEAMPPLYFKDNQNTVTIALAPMVKKWCSQTV